MALRVRVLFIRDYEKTHHQLYLRIEDAIDAAIDYMRRDLYTLSTMVTDQGVNVLRDDVIRMLHTHVPYHEIILAWSKLHNGKKTILVLARDLNID